jgi:hypothetical protein
MGVVNGGPNFVPSGCLPLLSARTHCKNEAPSLHNQVSQTALPVQTERSIYYECKPLGSLGLLFCSKITTALDPNAIRGIPHAEFKCKAGTGAKMATIGWHLLLMKVFVRTPVRYGSLERTKQRILAENSFRFARLSQ